ncbi:MAG: SbcC/MukB-like Walker B domain-containing protein [Bacilli bacterium]|nr:SbcC/MukB-like Walker B domain-containing protein [Bacilli bacterium]
MKKIKKLRLINWHFFEDQEINCSDINVITGENGTGKSTILDAIHYLQSGGTCKFNMAANTLSHGRTVENYLKARIGVENKEFLREQSDIIGHVAMEYFDTLLNKTYILGCVIQLVSNQLSSVDFYEIKGEKWNDALFFTESGNVRSYDSLYREGQAQRLNIVRVGQPRSSNATRAKAVRDALGVPEKYDTLFTKAMSFEPLNDINRFAIDFLLPEQAIDLTTIKGSMDNYRELQVILQNELRRKELLEPIFNYKDRYELALKEKDAFDLLMIKATIQMEDESIKINNREIEKAETVIKSNEKLIEKHNTDKLNYEIEAKRLEDDEAYNALNEAKRLQKQCLEEIAKVQREIKSWKSLIDEESSLANKLGTSLDLSNVINRKNYQDYLNVLLKYKERLEDISNKNEEDWKAASIESKKLEDILRELDKEIKSLEAGSYDYPPYVNQLVENIKQEILNKKGISNPQILPFCNLFEIKEDEWRYAGEGYLDRSRFDLFIGKRDFVNIAKECFERNPKLKDYYGVGVITSLPSSQELNPNSLANKVQAVRFDESKQAYVELTEPTNYLRFLLNDIICVESVNDFVEGQRAITKEGVYFDGHTIKHVNKEAGLKSYIGQESIKLRLAKAQEERKKISGDKVTFDKTISTCNVLRQRIKESSIKELLGYNNLWEEETSLAKNEKGLEDRIKELVEGNDDLLNRSETIARYKKMAFKEKVETDKLTEENKKLDRSIGERSNANKTSAEKIKDKTAEFDGKLSLCLEKNADIKDMIDSLSENLEGKKLYDMAFQRSGTASAQIKNYEQVISRAISDYCHSYPNELKPELDNYLSFVKRYNKIVNDELAKLEPDVEKARERSVQELREHFISKIRNAITNAKMDINELNRVLKKHPFGTDSEVFEFYTQRSKDLLLAGVYRIAMDTNQDTVENNILTEDLDAESQETMKKVFEVLSTNEEDNDFKKLRKELLDYRNYLNYDIKININNSADTLFYSKNQDSKSGGETQTPFYALIAGAFQSVVSLPEKNKLSPCSLVVFDEAFNNMDGERIKQMLEFYKELNIQLIISVPSSRFGYISPYADNIISLAKVDNSVAVFETISREAK